MSGDSLGKLFKISNWGESHGKAIGVVIEGCPPLFELSEKDIQFDLDRRLPGQSEVTTPRKELDKVEILSGVFNGRTTGAPISLIIFNKDFKKEDYKEISKIFRPSHSDFTYEKKYGIRDPFGGGRASARLTAGNVAAGAIAKKILKNKFGTDIIAYVKKIKDIEIDIDPDSVSKRGVESNIVRCPNNKIADQMINLIKKAQADGDSLGGVIECIAKNVPAGLGEPIFDKLDADLAKAMMAINATKGFEIGSGFEGVKLYGSQHNDPFYIKGKKILTKTNNSGGVQGGISNGMPIVFRVAFKPTSTIQKNQQSVDSKGKEIELEAKGRHDPCVLPRAVPIVEGMAALVLCDHYLRFRAQCGENGN
ncbi:chorismate synthase [Candidatus Woesearchaeota archaeon]|jgi:chorismate synthase|nr:chorismate synthase [Candidatus Woesearchaeota archaeon]MDP6648099.1 chorismate synthase [Candidatus Woesearchaeota archaeon]|tara:strand:- start:2812 stop:3906 length:1095 start_codon:yes stop_codon:yes gene_type:complete